MSDNELRLTAKEAAQLEAALSDCPIEEYDPNVDLPDLYRHGTHGEHGMERRLAWEAAVEEQAASD